MKPTKKTNRRLLALCLALLCTLNLSACSLTGLLGDKPKTTAAARTDQPAKTQTPTVEGDPDCPHVFGDWKTVSLPTCTEDGSATRACAVCGKTENGVYKAKGHTEEAIPTVPATCFLGGSEGGTRCATCREILTPPTVSVPAGHPSYTNGLCTACGTPKDSPEGLAYLDLYNGTYGYESLASLPSGEALQQVYRDIDGEVRRFHTDPTLAGGEKQIVCALRCADYGLTTEQILSVWKTYRDDNPLYYWIANSVTCNEDRVNLLVLEEYSDGMTRIEQNQRIYTAISSYLSGLSSNATHYEIALKLHDGIVAAIDYAYDDYGKPQVAHWAHSVVGVFEKQGAVCEGFAKAFQLLMNVCGVECLYATGMGNTEAHAWNLLCLDGVWYGIDVTWDDNNSETAPYLYFCLSDGAFSQSHTPDLPTDTGMDYLYPLPAISETGLEWVTVYKGFQKLGIYSCMDDAFAAMTDTSGSYTVYLKGADGYHEPDVYYINGDFPQVKSLTVVGSHTRLEGGSFTATSLRLTRNSALQSNLTLKSLFLDADYPVTLTTGGYTLTAKSDTVYYSAVMDSVTVK